MSLDTAKVQQFVEDKWNESIRSTLHEYIRIPNQSPLYDPEWATNGHCDKAVDLLFKWAETQPIKGMKMEVIRLEERTPVIFIEIDATNDKGRTVLLYGHADKQPPLTDQWAEGLGPYLPVEKDGKLYGRGGADDGYAIFAALTAVGAMQAQGIPHDRYTVIIETAEESGSPDLPFYVDALKERIGTPALIVCLDSGCGNYEQFWVTTSLRGLVAGTLDVHILNDGVHSGLASGIVPSSFRIIRQLLSRIEDEKTGRTLVPEFECDIPNSRLEQAKLAGEVLGETAYCEFPFVDGAGPMGDTTNVSDMILTRTWRPMLSVTGVDGMPTLTAAGNVLRAHTALKLSIRMPPNTDAAKAGEALKKVVTENVPYGARTTLSVDKTASGWNAPEQVDWLTSEIEAASQTYYGKPAMYWGEGGSIPFMGMLGKKFPQAQFLVTGLLGPKSNAHGPNEFMHIDFMKKVICCATNVLAAQAKQ